jgi:acyl-CoA synthetase (AMP-forming)/AMP-acid ligase II
MPVGSVGELLIEGYTAARGYLGDREKTEKVFIENPAFTDGLPSESEHFQTARFYKSGDLCRWNSDGSISYIGRKDTQVCLGLQRSKLLGLTTVSRQIKLNGQRIELGEIEFHVKSKFPEGVQSAVELVAPASRSSSKALAVFFALDDTTIAPASQDRAHSNALLLPMDEYSLDLCKATENSLTSVLPSYMSMYPFSFPKDLY